MVSSVVGAVRHMLLGLGTYRVQVKCGCFDRLRSNAVQSCRSWYVYMIHCINRSKSQLPCAWHLRLQSFLFSNYQTSSFSNFKQRNPTILQQIKASQRKIPMPSETSQVKRRHWKNRQVWGETREGQVLQQLKYITDQHHHKTSVSLHTGARSSELCGRSI